jgi:hypothetical protein
MIYVREFIKAWNPFRAVHASETLEKSRFFHLEGEYTASSGAVIDLIVIGYILSTDRTPPKAHSRQLFALIHKPVRDHSFPGNRWEFINAWRDKKGGASKEVPQLMANITLPPMAYSTHPESKRVCFPHL